MIVAISKIFSQFKLIFSKSEYLKAISYILLIFLFSSCDIRYGLIESEFSLSPASRLPKWFIIPSNYSRDNLTMTLTFYTYPFPPWNKIKMVVSGFALGNKVTMKMIGNFRYHPFTELKPRYEYPRYIVITVDKIEEVFEHKERNDILSITDDPEIVGALK